VVVGNVACVSEVPAVSIFGEEVCGVMSFWVCIAFCFEKERGEEA
jgi:hypothetical protein